MAKPCTDFSDIAESTAPKNTVRAARSLHHRDFRGFRRPDQAQADSRAARAGRSSGSGPPLRHHRFCAFGHERRQVPPETAAQAAAQGNHAADDAGIHEFAQAFSYVAGEYHHPEAFAKLAKKIEEVDKARNLEGNRLFYLATPPDIYPVVIGQIQKAGLATSIPTGNPGYALSSKSRSGMIWPQPKSWNPRYPECLRGVAGFTASITISARRRSRIFWWCALATVSSSRCGTATTWTMCRSPRRKAWAWSSGGRSTK